MTNKISFLICSKNDNYEGIPIDRLRNSILQTSNNTTQYNNYEYLIGDWGSEKPIFECLNINVPISIKHFYIPKEITNLFDTPISEVHCLNFLAKQATNPFVGRIDQDTIIGSKFFKYIEKESLDINGLYHSTRHDLPNNSLIYEEASINCPGCYENFWMCAVGILMVSKNKWLECKGYNEQNIHRDHMEHEFFHRLAKTSTIYNIGCLLNSPFYHIFHSRNQINQRKTNIALNINQLSNLNYTVNDNNFGLEKYKTQIIKK